MHDFLFELSAQNAKHVDIGLPVSHCIDVHQWCDSLVLWWQRSLCRLVVLTIVLVVLTIVLVVPTILVLILIWNVWLVVMLLMSGPFVF